MSDNSNVRFKVSNFGPIKEGEFELKPLTIFIGPNNSGKSYMATLVYALTMGLSRPEPASLVEELSDDAYDELKSWASKWTNEAVDHLTALPATIKEELERGLEQRALIVEKQLEQSLIEYFGDSDLNSLRRSDAELGEFEVVVQAGELSEPFISIHAAHQNETPTFRINRPNLDLALAGYLRQRSRTFLMIDVRGSAWEFESFLVDEAWDSFWKQSGFALWKSYYLPSARSGILQIWPLFTSLAYQALRVGRGNTQPYLSGVPGDFLQTLWDRLSRPDRRSNEEMGPTLNLLEGQVFHGKVSVPTPKGTEPLSILYRTGSVRIPVQRASSMIAELTPVALWIKYLLQPGDLLIIDEPEAHLHPENLRLIARVLVRLVRAGVRVICPTHSATILHQISNLILAAQLDDDERKRLSPDFTEDDMISKDEIGVYWFDLQEDGAHIKEVPIDNEFGISEDMFVRSAEAIGEETYKLSLAVIGEDGVG